MATVDPLLRLAAAQGADELVLRAGSPPALRGRGGVRGLSMPIMDESLVRIALREVVGDDADKSEGDGRYPLASQGAVRVRWRLGERVEVTFARVTEAAHKPALAEPRVEPRVATPLPAVNGERPVEATHDEPRRAIDPVEETLARAHLARIVSWARQQEASDVVLTDGRPIAARVHGVMVRGEEALRAGAVAAMLDGILDARHRARLAREGSADAGIELDAPDRTRLRFRVNRFRTLAGDSAVLRPVRDTPPTLRSLRLPEAVARFAELRDGLVLVTGPAGSGKSTTLVAMIEHLNRMHARHVITLEDPIEYVFTPDRAVVHQREIGVHVATFAEGLRAALREAPDVILLGELRDPETIAAAVTAAETGHLVLATLHSASTAAAFDRIIDSFPEHQQRQVRNQLADVLRAVIGQRLLPARGGGRVPALEILQMTPAIAHMVREGKGFQIPQTLQTGREQGLVPLARAVAELVRNGVVERSAALEAVPDPQHVLEALR